MPCSIGSSTRLAQTGAVSERQGKQAIAAAEQQEAVVFAAKRRVEAARGGLTTARANLENPGIRAAQEAMVRKQMTQQEAGLGPRSQVLTRLAQR